MNPKATVANVLVLLSMSVLTGFLLRLVGLTALQEHVNALALRIASFVPHDHLPRKAAGIAGYSTHDQLLNGLLGASIGVCLLALVFAVVTYWVVTRFGAARSLRGVDRGNRWSIASSLRSATRLMSLRSSALIIALVIPLAWFSWTLWNNVEFQLSMMHPQVVNNMVNHPSLGLGIGRLGQTLLLMAASALALVASVWWVDRRTYSLAERGRLIHAVCGACGYERMGLALAHRCPECGELSAPLPSPTLRTAMFLFLAATFVLMVTLGPLLLGLLTGLFMD